METVAGENPLAFATSRMVVVRFFSLARFTRARLRGHHHPAKAAQIATKRCASRRLFCRDVEGHFRAEPGSPPCSVGNTDTQPNGARDFCRRTEIPPDKRADDKAQHGHQEIPHLLFFRAREVTHERSGIPPHESDESPKVKECRSTFTADQKPAE